MWQSLREYRAGIPERLARWKRAELASQETLAQVGQHEPSSCDILGPLEEGIRVVAGEILEEEAVTLEEEAAIREEEAILMTNCQANNLQSSKETDENPRRLCRNGTSIEASIDSLHK